jgi:hypothetical protein
MSGSEKDRLAALVIDQHYAFQQALAGSRKRYPTREFRSFAAVMRQYVDATREDEMLHRGVVRAAQGLVEYLQRERNRVPNEVLLEAERPSSATIRTSTAMSLLVCDLTCRHFGNPTVSIPGMNPTYQP